MDKLTSSRNGMVQMAMYMYQAYLDDGQTEEQAKLSVAQEIEKIYEGYTGQAGVKRPLPKRALPLAEEVNRYVTTADNDSIYFKMLRRKIQDLLDVLKKG